MPDAEGKVTLHEILRTFPGGPETEAETEALVRESKAAALRRDACAMHKFVNAYADRTPRLPEFREVIKVCVHCKWRADAIWMQAYEQGLAHGRANGGPP